MKFVVVLCVLVVMMLHVSELVADQRFGNILVSEVTSVYDADTFRVNIQGWPAVVGKHMSVRVLGVDAPELRGKCEAEKNAARLAKQFTVEALRSAKMIELRKIKRGKYFRLLAEVYIDGVNLGEMLIQANHARAYDGGKRLSWCE